MAVGEKPGMGEKMGELLYNKPWILQRADPYVYRHTDGTYYFTASVPAYDGIVAGGCAGDGSLAQA